MKTYDIPVYWMMSAMVRVEAESLKDAMEQALEGDLPLDGEYVNDSVQTDEEIARDMNQE